MSIYLTCINANSNKFYRICKVANELLGEYGSIGATHRTSNKGAFNQIEALKLLHSKVAKGYEIESVNGKPFSGTVFQAVQALANGSFVNITPQFTPKKEALKPSEFVFNEAITSPIW